MDFKVGDTLEILSKSRYLYSYQKIEEIREYNQLRVLDAFKRHHFSETHFVTSTGYGYDDIGRDTLNKVYAEVFETEEAVVSPYISCGTYAITLGLFNRY